MSDQTITDMRLSDGVRGFLMALGAYGLWGALPFISRPSVMYRRWRWCPTA